MNFDWGQLGLSGAVIVALATVVIKQDRDKDALYKQMNSLQEQRIQDARVTRDRLGDQMEVMNKTMTLIYDKLLDSKRNP